MDIQLSDGSCFDIFRRMEIRTPVIFTTVYDQYALDAFKVNSIDYLLKPIDEDGITFAVPSSGEKRIVDYTIESLEPLLDPKSFFRITRGCLASIGSIEKASRYFSGRLEILLKDSTRLVLSRARVQDFLRWMDDK